MTKFEVLDGSFVSRSHGENIFYKTISPKAPAHQKKINIYFCHGAGEYHDRHLPFFQKLLEADIECDITLYFFDLVGHGHSSGSRAYVKNFTYYCEDYLQYLEFIKQEHSLEQNQNVLNIMGSHSMGGLVSLKLLMEFKERIPFKFNGLFFSNPCISPKLKLPNTIRQLIFSVKNELGKIRVPSFYSPSDISTDEEKAKSFVADPLISKFMTLAMAREIIKQSRKVRGYSYYIDTPCLFLISENDAIVDSKTTKLFAKSVDKSLISIKNYQSSAHDLLNDKESEDVQSEIIKWLNSL